MFWSGNYIAVREVNSLLKEENVTLTQVLEADDILQECKNDTKPLVQFLTRPDILGELITLITEEPPKNMELASQYRHASIACEVLTSRLSTLSDRLSSNTVLMNRLCDFIARDPPLNPLLASYFSRTIEMLLDRSRKQDCYLYHIVCLRVLDFLVSRRDFLPNLLRHISTSAIADTFKYFIRLDDVFSKIIMEWFDEHQFLESLIQIICGTYAPDPPEVVPTPLPAATQPVATQPATTPPAATQPAATQPDATQPATTQLAAPQSADTQPAAPQPTADSTQSHNHAGGEDIATNNTEGEPAAGAGAGSGPGPGTDPIADYATELRRVRGERLRGVASANAAGLLWELVLGGAAGEGGAAGGGGGAGAGGNGAAGGGGGAGGGAGGAGGALVARLQAERGVRALLQGMFTSPPRARRHAVVNGTQVLLALLSQDPILLDGVAGARRGGGGGGGGEAEGEGEAERTSVELALAPHLPLLHQALLQPPGEEGAVGAGTVGAVGAARVHVAALVAALAASEVEEVPTTMLALGTPALLADMFLAHPHNNFLHAQVCSMLKAALANDKYREQYAHHLFVECDLLTKLMDTFEENETKNPRGAYMGHVVSALRTCARVAAAGGALRPALGPALGAPLLRRWDAFLADTLRPLLARHDTPLGGYYPSENTYEMENMVDPIENSYEYNAEGASALPEAGEAAEAGEAEAGEAEAEVEAEALAGGAGAGEADGDEHAASARESFLELVKQRFDDNMWEDGPSPEPALEALEADGAAADAVFDALHCASPWEAAALEGGGGGGGGGGAGGGGGGGGEAGAEGAGGEGWAQFEGFAQFPAQFPAQDYGAFWPYGGDDAPPDAASPASPASLERGLQQLRLGDSAELKLANNLLTAMSGMAPDVLAGIVNAALPDPPAPAPAPAPALGDDTAPPAPPATPATPATPAPPPGSPSAASER